MKTIEITKKPVRVIVCKTKLDVEHLLGQFLDESHYDILIEEDCDVYAETDCEPGIRTECKVGDDCSECELHDGKVEAKIIAKFRKNYFTKEEQEQAYIGLRGAAGKSQNRGLAAGPRVDKLNGRDWVTPAQLDILDFFSNPFTTLSGEDPVAQMLENQMLGLYDKSNRGWVWKTEFVEKEKFHFDSWVESTRKLPQEEMKKQAEYVMRFISDTTYANEVYSGVAGWYDRYPRIPFLRATAYTESYPDLFAKAYPFLQSLNRGFRDMMPIRWNAQMEAAKKIDPGYLVPGTPFTTITVNKTFRTAAHYDAGDLNAGLSNLLVLSNTGKYTGGYLIAPQYRAAFNVRPGDLLLINNHEVMHGNTPIVCESEKDERISVVCYFREGMLNGGAKEYEELRYEFVESRRTNPDHPLQRLRWNGISPDMWADKPLETDYAEAREWYDFLKKHKNGNKYLNDYHPWLKEAFEGVKLEEFFG
jgi:hypothetical protein